MQMQPAGACDVCSGPVLCRYNHFEKAAAAEASAFAIDSWEHKCSDCGKRITHAFRTEANAAGELIIVSPLRCPFCHRLAS